MYPHSQTGHLYRLRKKLMREGNKARTADFSIGPTLQVKEVTILTEGKTDAAY